jgi:predicted TIM-barrel fold metal-dependent hydrolase
VLAAQTSVAGGRFRGIRNSSVWDEDETIQTTRIRPPKGLFYQQDFRQGFSRLGKLNLSFDAWLYHPQIPELADLALAFPETRIVLDHVGAPLGVGRHAGKRKEVFDQWRCDIRKLAECPNVFVKLGGLGMPVMGFAFESARSPPTSDELAAVWRPYFEVCIESFGAKRCMFESNFPVDKQSCSYPILWNAFKRMSKDYSAAERDDLFRRTAASVYGLEVA